MSQFDYDFFVIGAGSGGVRAARMAGSYGAKTAIAESRFMGGTCVNVGCVPKKLFVYASEMSDAFKDAAGYGWRTGEPPTLDWPALVENKNKEIERLNGIYANLLANAGVEIFNGRAVLIDAHTIAIGDRQVTAKYILIATGGRPSVPEFPGSEYASVSDDMFYLDQLPDKLVIVGGGYIAVEFAGIMHRFGVNVTQLYRGPLFLRGFDEDCRKALADEMRKTGIDLRFKTNITSIEKSGEELLATLTDGSSIEADRVLFATGRVPNTTNIGLETVGVTLRDNGAVAVDDYSKTSIDYIYAVGDCTDRVQLTPVAIAEGAAVAATLFDNRPTPVTHENIPSAVFSQPPIGTVGLTEEQASEKFSGEIDVYTSTFRPMKYILPDRDKKAFMKLIVARKTEQVVGVHILAPDAGEIVQGIGLALKCGATKAQFDATVGVHPTTAEELVTMRNKRE